MRKTRIKPSKIQSKMSFIVGIIFSLFGLGMIITGIKSPFPMIMVPFSLVWTGICVFNVYISYKNGFTDEGMPYYEIDSVDSEEEIQRRDNEQALSGDFSKKLRELENLRDDGLITEEEYQAKRTEIMNDKW